MSSSDLKNPPSKVADGQYETVKRLGAGVFGEIYCGKKTGTGKTVAIKFESKQGKGAGQLANEAMTIRELRRGNKPPQGVVECFYFGAAGTFNCMVMEILGKSLEDQVQECSGKLTVKTTVLIAEQVLQRIELLHSKGYVHRDIKPENFMFGVKGKIHHVYIIDFGLRAHYWDDSTGAHAQMKQDSSLTGTARYCSINAQKKVGQSRRDDMEAIGHMFLYFLRGDLPWANLEATTREERFQKILEIKERTPLAELCQTFPKQFEDYLHHARNLSFTDKPDYNMLFSNLKEVRDTDWNDHSFQWFDDKEPEIPLVPLVPRSSSDCLQPDDKKTSGCFCFCGGKHAPRD